MAVWVRHQGCVFALRGVGTGDGFAQSFEEPLELGHALAEFGLELGHALPDLGLALFDQCNPGGEGVFGHCNPCAEGVFGHCNPRVVGGFDTVDALVKALLEASDDAEAEYGERDADFDDGADDARGGVEKCEFGHGSGKGIT